MKNLIVIPARHASTRLPAKPLTPVGGVPLLERVARVARRAAEAAPDETRVLVATDHEDIRAFAVGLGLDTVMTDPDCPSGTDRVWRAIEARGVRPERIVNLQGDNPTCPPWFIAALLDELGRHPDAGAATLCVRLSWVELDALREHKKTAPASGTFVEFATEDPDARPAAGRAIAFSKREIPYLRREPELRAAGELSPLYRHVGLYGYRYDALRAFVGWPESRLERLEGLEQWRFLERGVPMRVAEADARGRPLLGGVDEAKDVERTARYFAEYGEY